MSSIEPQPAHSASVAPTQSLPHDKLFLAFMANLPGAAWIKDTEGRYLFANERVARATQTSVRNILGKTDAQFASDEMAAVVRRSDTEVQRQGQPVELIESVSLDGQLRHLFVVKFPIRGDDGNLQMIGGFGVDITEMRKTEEALQESEHRVRALLNATSDLVLLIDPDGRVLLINSNGAGRLGKRPEQIEGTSCYSWINPEAAAARRAQIERAIQTRQPVRFEDERNGRCFDNRVFPLLSSRSEVTQIAIFATDVTERMEAEEKLKNYARRLELLSQQLVEAQESERHHLARELHDEVGQALTAIQINLQSVLRQPGAVVPAAPLQESLRLLEDLVRKTQDLSLKLRPTLLDDLGLPAVLSWLTRQQAARAGLRTDFWASPIESRLDPAIETACFRVAQEALTNVLRHAQAGQVTVQLLREEDSLHLVIHDDGRGFDVSAALARSGTATCVGLLGMLERVSLVGGRFECKSSPQSGTEVHAWFPLKWRAAGPGANPA
jgi:PAS domain S-box-containing protein